MPTGSDTQTHVVATLLPPLGSVMGKVSSKTPDCGPVMPAVGAI
jgi:hypothetical protein